MKRIFESIEKTEDGWFGYLPECYATKNGEITICALTKKGLYENAKARGVHKISLKKWLSL